MAEPNMRVLVYNGEGAGGRCSLSLRDSLELSLRKHGVEVSTVASNPYRCLVASE